MASKPVRRMFLFTKPTELHGIIAHSGWAKGSIKEAITMGTGGWFCLFVNGQYRVAVDISKPLVKLGFQYVSQYACSEPEAKQVCHAAAKWHIGKIQRAQLEALIAALAPKVPKSKPMQVARRLASENPCAVLSATCLDCVSLMPADFSNIEQQVCYFARRIIKP